MGVKGLSVAPGFWVLLCLVWIADEDILLPAALAAALHELGHLLALRALGARPAGLRLTALGAELRLERELAYAPELLAALAGPVMSLLAAWGAARLGAYLFAGLSLALGLFNLLPIAPLDGGRALACLLALLLPPESARRAAQSVSIAAAGLLLGVSWAIVWRLRAFSLLLPALWLAWRSVAGEKNA